MINTAINFHQNNQKEEKPNNSKSRNQLAADENFSMSGKFENITRSFVFRQHGSNILSANEELNKRNIDNIYKTLLAIHASYNLLGKVDSKNIISLLSYVDISLESFIGYRLEILYLLSLTQNNIIKTNNLYDEIINNDKISSSIKERVKKINGFKKYK